MNKKYLHFIVSEMMMKDRWEEQYNPNHDFNVDQYEYDTKQKYLNALRTEWQIHLDPFNEFTEYVNVYDYDNYEEYEYDISECINKVDSQNYYDPDHEFPHLDPLKFDDEQDYKDAVEIARSQKEWQDEYDPYKEFSTDPYNYEYEDEYLDALRLEWKDEYDYFDEYPHIDPDNYNTAKEYQNAIEAAQE